MLAQNLRMWYHWQVRSSFANIKPTLPPAREPLSTPLMRLYHLGPFRETVVDDMGAGISTLISIFQVAFLRASSMSPVEEASEGRSLSSSQDMRPFGTSTCESSIHLASTSERLKSNAHELFAATYGSNAPPLRTDQHNEVTANIESTQLWSSPGRNPGLAYQLKTFAFYSPRRSQPRQLVRYGKRGQRGLAKDTSSQSKTTFLKNTEENRNEDKREKHKIVNKWSADFSLRKVVWKQDKFDGHGSWRHKKALHLKQFTLFLELPPEMYVVGSGTRTFCH